MSENVKSENYVNIQGWMITELGLKGNELIAYAIIYGFSQKQGQYFNGGYQYLADWTNSSKQTVINIMKSLEEKGFIVRIETGNSSGKSNSYYAVRDVVKKLDQSKNLTSKKTLPEVVKKFDEGSQKTLPHNIYILNNNKDDDVPKEQSTDFEKDNIEFKNKIIELRNIAVKATGLSIMQVESLIKPCNYRNIDLDLFLQKIKSSDFLMGKNSSEKPTMFHFSVKRGIDMVMADVYKNKTQSKKKEDVSKIDYGIDEDTEKLYKSMGL